MNEPYNNYYILQASPLWLTHHHWYIPKGMSVQISDSRYSQELILMEMFLSFEAKKYRPVFYTERYFLKRKLMVLEWQVLV